MQRLDGSVRKSRPSRLAVVKGFYTFINKSGNKDDSVEKLFTVIETDSAPLFDCVNSVFPLLPNGEEKHRLALLMASIVVRSPRHRKESEIIANFAYKLDAKIRFSTRDSTLESMREAGIEATDANVEEIMGFADDDSLRIVPHKNELIKESVNTIPIITEELKRRCWDVVVFDQDCLLIGDEPLVCSDGGIANAQEVWFPVSSRRLIVMSKDYSWRAPKIIKGTQRMATAFNQAQLSNSNLEVFGQSDILKPYKGIGRGERPKVEVSGGFDPEWTSKINKIPFGKRPINR